MIARIFSLLLVSASLTFAAGGWSDNFDNAKAQAKKENKVILLDFTGSDWCSWCMRLEKQVFAKKEFMDYAKENLVLVVVDFPRQGQQGQKLKEQNEALARQYGVKRYPSVLLVDAEGKVLGQTGYKLGGPTTYVEHLKSLISKKGA